MSKEPIFSFIVPVYKKPPEVFEKCLDSLFDMSVKNIEVIAVFDGSDAELERVLNRYSRVKKVVIEHGGAPKARNAGFKESTGRYVSFWDCDTFAKPEMAKVWLDTFDRNSDAAFVYSGYEFTNERGAVESEQFNPYSLRFGNYIASMFPLKRELVPQWDESLKAAQDWDYWLTVVENGGKGVFIQGYGFKTEPSFKDSISYEGWSPENRDETIRKVREKHGIPDNPIVFFSHHYGARACQLAKICRADLLKPAGYGLDHYKVCASLGVRPQLFKMFPSDSVKVIYWLPMEIEILFHAGYSTVKETIRQTNELKTVNFCNDFLSKNKLKEIGIDAEILDLPIETEETFTELPSEFKVLVDADEAYFPVVKSLQKDLPYIKIDYLKELGGRAPFSTYSLLVSFYQFPTIDESIKGMLLNGRHVISNVQAPFCGFLDLEVNHPEFLRELFTRVRLARELPFNKQAQDYYKTLVDPEKFKKRIFDLLPKPVMEIV